MLVLTEVGISFIKIIFPKKAIKENSKRLTANRLKVVTV